MATGPGFSAQDFRFTAGPHAPAPPPGGHRQIVRLRLGPVAAVLAVGERGHEVRARWPGGRWVERGGWAAAGLSKRFFADQPYWSLEQAAPLHYRATGRLEQAELPGLDADAVPGRTLRWNGEQRSLTLRYWVPMDNLIVRALYAFPAEGWWILTQSAWEWRGEL